MKHLIIYLLILIFNIKIFSQNIIQTKFANILNDFDALMQTEKNNDLYQKFEYIKNKTLTYEIVFYIDGKENKSIFGSSGFTPKELSNTGNHYITINAYLINIYSKRPSIVLSILINAFMSANIYFNNIFNKYNKFLKDINFYIDRFEALKLEAFFIANYLYKNEYKLTKFENYLLENYLNNNINETSFNCYFFDYNLASELKKIKNSDVDIDKKLIDIERLGKDSILNNELKENDDDKSKYKKLVSLLTYKNFSDETINYLKENTDKGTMILLKNENYKNVKNIIKEINKILNKKNIDFCNNYYNRFINNYNNVD